MQNLIRIFAVLIYTSMLLFSCTKEQGKNYLRVYNHINDPVTNMTIMDESDTIPLDGQYHEIHRQLEIGYLLPHVVFDSVINFTSDLYPWPEMSYTDCYVSHFFGELEQDEHDRYYTLDVYYKRFLNDPQKSRFSIKGKSWYSIYIQYVDCSKFSYGYVP